MTGTTRAAARGAAATASATAALPTTARAGALAIAAVAGAALQTPTGLTGAGPGRPALGEYAHIPHLGNWQVDC